MVRFKHRYLLCEVVSDDPRCRLSLEDRALGGLIRDTIARVHGTFGAASCSIGFAGARVRGNWAVGGITRERALKGEREGVRATAGASRSDTAPLYVRYLNAYTGIVLLRCRKEFYQLVCSALPFITYLENKGHRYPCFLNTLHVGGTIRTCQKFLIRYNRRQLLILLQNCTDEGEREAIQKSVTKSCLLEERSDEEELSDSGGEEAAEAME
ncbi:ribonuclease P/MRP protein subunit POP5 isoform X1 [Canis lupus familiaris]|uniref:ribonuclease P/MRP protein subunit POP5 isoform X1 n=1 Tax=Canis lupus familiaris TaxID=9615 RepID=UPI000BAA186D|nr:ribonuclease P/MRP protein subunit POP5 isoform X1 [Canis lupus familiaris]XP_038292860.1 ribonuclease P/MRP protein subunit POP5 isoform X1 [Canis lupus familiaris]XP_038431251.1 ribonuclease P/MRP protein subunit POP5 isoform X1 [Canis lupus familiaris]|eukprot:XP_022266150.1 ribonuclease P/MRP protein subunit POP5 isoform X1 [Canis lupus familiaris]